MTKEPTGYDPLREWLTTAGLYKPLHLSRQEAEELAIHIDTHGLRVDSYCPSCKQDSVFTFRPKSKNLKQLSQLGATDYLVVSFWRESFSQIGMTCARNSSHPFVLFLFSSELDVGGMDLTKIGQLPSMLDLLSAEQQHYAKLLDSAQSRELRSAMELAAHGYWVGAFVYLRRIFERLVEAAHAQARGDAGWDETKYNPNMRMDERISLLRAHLPDFLVQNRVLYGILSKGIHELTETECQDAYQAVELGIHVILDEEIQRRERAAKVKQAATSLEKVRQRVEGKN